MIFINLGEKISKPAVNNDIEVATINLLTF